MMDNNLKESVDFNSLELPLMIFEPRRLDDYGSKWHECIEIKYVVSGTIHVMVDTNIYCAKEGDVIFINPYEFHSNIASKDSGSYVLMLLDLGFFRKIDLLSIDLKHLMIAEQYRFNRHITDSDISRIIAQIICEYNDKKDYKNLMIGSLMQQLFVELLRKEHAGYYRNNLEKQTYLYKMIEPAVVCYRDRYFENFKGDEMASLCGLSRDYFGRVFKSAIGMTPVQYQNECRVRIADVLLRSGDYTVSEIAEKVGFEDVSYFIRVYKKIRGFSPGNKKNKGL